VARPHLEDQQIHGKRRITLRDLLEAGLISAGEQLRFSRPRSGEDHLATVSATGRIVFPDGTEHSTPSDAAKAVTDTQVNGWTCWRTSAGRILASLRSEFLDTSEEIVDSVEANQFLTDVEASLRAGETVVLTVRELLRHWNARTRGTRITRRIERDLASHGVTTFPHFRNVTLDTQIRLSPIVSSSPPREPKASEMLRMHTLAALGPDDDVLQIGLKVGNLESALGGVTYVPPESTLEQAITHMQADDFSQLAVMSASQRKLDGAVTWKSIAIARHNDPNATLRDCLITAPEISYDQDLVDVLGVLESIGFVFVRNAQNKIDGIVTAADLADAYGDMATPFFLIGELDQLLRHIIARHIDLADVIALCDSTGSREITSFNQLTMGDYERTLQNPDAWSQLGARLDRSVVCKRLAMIREIRNDIMHFNPEDIPKNSVDMLRNFLRMIRTNVPGC
jgi:CBS domain-containing protein